jgi:substrate import-associated zinc metallohydrolase lipoprotein
MEKIKTFLLMLILLITVWSCKEEDLSSESIFKESTAEQTDFDRWLLSNYTYPYNITFKYKMQDIESSYSYQLVPATINQSIAAAKLIKYLWIETYDEVSGIDFTRTYIPKVIHLIGSGGYNSTGSVVLGTASQGMKATFYDINSMDVKDIKGLREGYFKTMFHEFTHILHQNKNYSVEFGSITNNDYVSDDWSASTETLALAYSKGFVSRYARKEPDEDFVETLAHFVVLGQENWDNILAAAGPTGAANINAKFDIVKDYLSVSWGIDIYELRRVFERRLASLDQLDLVNPY